MEVQIKIEKLRKRKLFVATPMYGGHCTGIYCQSTNKLSMLFSKYNIELELRLLSFVPVAPNVVICTCVAEHVLLMHSNAQPLET